MNDRIVIYGAHWCLDCKRIKDFLEKNQIKYEYINLDLSPEDAGVVESINNRKKIIPTLVLNEQTFVNPQNHMLERLFGINKQGNITMFGADWCPDCRRAKRYLRDNMLNFRFIDIDKSPDAADFVIKMNNGKRIIPTIQINGSAYSNPDNSQLLEVLGLERETNEKLYDVVIIGSGAAGLTSAIYAQRDKFDSLILESKNIGGNAFITKKIENYPGFKEISGPELTERMAEQAAVLGAKIETGIEVTQIQKQDGYFKIYTNLNTFKGRSIIAATGSTYRKLGIEGEKELIGSGVHFCATCDGAFYRDREIIVIGGGDSALEEGMFLAGFCKKVSVVHRSEKFSATKTYTDKLSSISNIETFLNYSVEKFVSDDKGQFKSAILKHNKTREKIVLKADGVFIFIGLVPNTHLFNKMLELSDSGHILTKGLNQTNVPGIFAAGDCRNGAIAQVAAATGEGVVASYGIREFLTNSN